MIRPYHVYSLGKLYREEALQVAWVRHLEASGESPTGRPSASGPRINNRRKEDDRERVNDEHRALEDTSQLIK
jgi:hypothetical protein